jgi:hypothetical protein
MKNIREEYMLIFNEIEESPSCSIEWRELCVCKPRFEPLDRRLRVLNCKAQQNSGALQQNFACASSTCQDLTGSTNDNKVADILADNQCVSNTLAGSQTETKHSSDIEGKSEQHIDVAEFLSAGDNQQVLTVKDQPSQTSSEHFGACDTEIKPNNGQLSADNADSQSTATENGKLFSR